MNKNPDLRTIDIILDLSIQLPIRDLLDSATVFYLIEDILECNTIDVCESIFQVIESKAEQLSQVSHSAIIIYPKAFICCKKGYNTSPNSRISSTHVSIEQSKV